jgi:membrane protein DedA with SNARE-associated domain
MPFWRFTFLTLAGCIPWVLMLAIIGREVGDNWEQWRDYLHYLDYPVALALIAGAIWLLIRWRRDDDSDQGGAKPAETTA